MSKKKLLIVTDSFLPRCEGITRFLFEIIPKLTDSYKITILAPKFDDKEYKIDGVDIVRMPVMKIQFGDLYPAKFNYKGVKKLVEQHDIVFIQSIAALGLSAVKAAKKLEKPIVAYAHVIEYEIVTKSLGKMRLFVKHISKMFMKYAYNKINLLLVPFSEVGELFRKQGIKVPYAVVPLGVDSEKFKPAENKIEAKEKLNIDPKHIIIGYVGRIGREKNLLTLYRAFRKLEKRYDNIRLMIVGKGVKDEEKIFTQNRNIMMTGMQNDVVPYLQAMDIFVMPSLTETSSLATMEAMACGLPVVSTPVGLVKEYVEERRNGMFFPFKNSLVLSMKLEKLINNAQLRVRMGANARETMKEKYNWEKTVTLIKDAIRYF